MKILVTGGAGFIGANFVFYMLDAHPDYDIVCLDELTYAGNLETLEPVMDNPGFRFVKGDVADRLLFSDFSKKKRIPETLLMLLLTSQRSRMWTGQLRIRGYS